MPKERAGTRNVFIYPEKQTAVERLSARIVKTCGPYLDADIDDDSFDELSLELKTVGRRFIRELKDDNSISDTRLKANAQLKPNTAAKKEQR